MKINKNTFFTMVFACAGFCSVAQIAGGIYTVGTSGSEDYTSFTQSGGVFDAINSNGIGGDVTFLVTTDLNESGSVGLSAWAGNNTVSIVPATAAVKTITHTGSCADDMFTLDGVDLLTIDGRFNGSGTARYLCFVSSCSDQSIIRAAGDCENVVIRNCSFYSDNNTVSNAYGGVINVASNQINGSDSLQVLYNLVKDYSGSLDLVYGIVINAPSNAGATLDGLEIIGNELCNINGKGILILSNSGSVEASLVCRNSYYATGALTGPGTGYVCAPIQVESGSGHTIRANYIGGQGAFCSGSKMNIALAGGTQTINLLRIRDTAPNVAVNMIDSNVFRNISITGSSANVMFCTVIRIEGGNCNVGSQAGNIIGDVSVDATSASNASLVVENADNSTNSDFYIIRTSSSGTVNVENNQAGGILIDNNNGTGLVAYLFISEGSSANFRNNVVGGVENNIVKSSDYNFRIFYSNGDDAGMEITGNIISGITADSEFSDDFHGIHVTSGSGSPLVDNNTFTNLNIGGAGASPRVYVIRADNLNPIISGNEITDISIESGFTTQQFFGIYCSGSGNNAVIQNNRLSNVHILHTSAAMGAIGIYTTGSSSTYTIESNFLDKFLMQSSSTSSYFRIIQVNSATLNKIINNVVLVSNGSLTNSIIIYGIYDDNNQSGGLSRVWHNTVDVRGRTTGTARTACYYRTGVGNRDIRNNIFNSRRKRLTGSGNNYAMYHNSTSGTMVCDYNMLYCEDDLSELVRYSSDLSFSDWQNTGYGTNSVTTSIIQNLVDSITGHPVTNGGSDKGAGTLGVLEDYNDTVRPLGSGYDMGAFEMITESLAAVLPVELLYFRAETLKTSVGGHEVFLRWSTATETNNDYFTVEKSPDGRACSEVGQLAGAGNSRSILHYTVSDKSPYTGTSFYRLKQTDYNGVFSCSPWVPVVIEEALSISAHPNPCTDRVWVSAGVREPMEISIRVFSPLSQPTKLFEGIVEPGADTVEMDVSGLKKGTYLLDVQTADKLLQSQLILIKK